MRKKMPRSAATEEFTELRIIGGSFRNSKLLYHGDPITRPMKERVREAIFNLISTECEGKHALDLFAGTGALGLEAISRGAVGATFIEKHVPTARVVEQNIASLAVDDCTELLMTSAFLWGKRDLPRADFKMRNYESSTPDQAQGSNLEPQIPWLVFCSPPYAFFIERLKEVLDLVNALTEYAPTKSIFVVEADERFDFDRLPAGIRKEKGDTGWDVRSYPPAVVGVWRK